MPALPDNNVIVRFAGNIPVEYHGPAMLALEKHLRQISGLRVEVFKEARGDDSRLRALMTTEQRAKL
jgi:hypothetical protein